jgi:hypothetical protein
VTQVTFVSRSLACASLVAALASPALAGGHSRKSKTPKTPPAPAPVATDPAPAPAPPPPPPADTPWSKGVPADVQAKANALYDEGNQLFAQQAHAPALEKYRAALALWNHPLIRFNLAVTEIRLERILEAADDLEQALRFGADPFKPELYQQALDYQTLVKGRVGFVEASCEQPNAHVLLDGKPWFSCPGKQKQRVMAGEHAIVGERQGYLTTSQKVVVAGGAVASQTVKLIPLDDAVVLRYPHRRWVPWTFTGVGLAVGLAGAGTWLLGKNQMTQFEADFAMQCPNGCEPGLTDPSHRILADERDSAQLKGKIGIAMMGVGGAVAITGIVLAIMNRPTRVLPNIEVAPTTGGASAAVGWKF